jgi:hypothetical protein
VRPRPTPRRSVLVFQLRRRFIEGEVIGKKSKEGKTMALDTKYITIANYEIETDTVMELGRFSILWANLEQRTFKQDCNSAEIKKLQDYTASKTDVLIYKILGIKEVLLKHWFRSPKEIDADWAMKNLFSSQNKGDDYWIPRIRAFLKGKNAEKDLIRIAVFICFRVRSNFFHGVKTLYTLNGIQLELFQAINAFLDDLKIGYAEK